MLTQLVRERLRDYPAVALVGPRQAGKTTLAKAIPGAAYFDLEDGRDRVRLDVQWEQIAAQTRLAVIDEAQEMPELFPRLRSAIDQDRHRHGRFLLLGSVAPALMTNVSQSLAGRLAICHLTPLLARELPRTRWDDLWRFGGYPDGGIQKPPQYPHWQESYIELLCQRDLPHWGLPTNPSMTTRLCRMIAAVHAQPWNASQLGKSLGLSYHTVNRYVDFLEHAFLVRRLPAFSTNIGRRLVKSPRVFWRDTGVLHTLLGLPATGDLLVQPWVGASWEGWIIEQILSHIEATGESSQASYMRTSDQKEIDLIIDHRARRWAFEIKLTSSPSAADLRSLQSKAQLVRADAAFLICKTSSPTLGKQTGILNLRSCLDLLLD